MRFSVQVGYDDQARVYYVLSSDISGLNIEAPTFEAFVEAVRDVVPDLLGDKADGSKIDFHLEIALA